MSAHWGEMPTQLDTASGIAAIEREQITKPRPMEVEGPFLHQPSSKHCPPSKEPHSSEAFAVDPLTLHTVKLIQYSRKLRSLISNAQQQLENLKSGEGEVPNFPACPAIPEYHGKYPVHKIQKPLPFLARNCEKPFPRGLGQPPPEIDAKTNRKLLRRTVSAICAHAGFDSCSESIIETLTDVSEEYYLQLTRLLRRAVDNEAYYGSTGFADTLEQVFQEMGIGSPVVLHEFYQNRIVNYHENMEKTCKHLRDEYQRIKSPENRPIEDIKPSVKEEPMSDIQFPTLDDGEENDTEQVLHLEGLGLEINIVNDTSNSLTNEEDPQKWHHGSMKQEPCDTKSRKPRPFVPPPLVIPPSIALSHVKKKLYEKVFSKMAGVSSLDSYDQEDSHNPNDPLGSVPSTPGLSSVPHTPGGDSIGNPGSVLVSDIMSPPSGLRKPPKKKKKR